MAFLKSGIPLGKLDCLELRSLIEENGFRPTDSRHLLDLVPFVLDEERTQIRSEVKDTFISIFFDGTTRQGEVLAVVVRYIANWKIEQRLVRLEILLKSLTGEELARELISILSVKLGLESKQILGAIHDRASVNGAAIRILQVMYPCFLDIGCLSHTLNLVGEKFKLPNLNLFISLWISLFAHSQKTKAYWKEQTGRAMLTFCKTRWWSRWEVMQQLFVQFGDVEPFLRRTDISNVTSSHLLDMITNPQTLMLLKIELAAVIDIGSYFVKATYNLESDGVLVVKCFEEILKIRSAIHTQYFPNVEAVARAFSLDNETLFQQLKAYALTCVQAGLN